MQSNFAPALKFTLAFEGGYSNHPADPGGATMKGVIQRTYDAYRRRKKLPTRTVREITDGELHEIYKTGYWDEVNGDGLEPGVDGAMFDYGVNSGPAAAKKSLLAVIGGPAHETVRKLCKRRLSIYQTFRHWKTFGKGWTRRITAGEALWVKWALAGKVDAPAVKDKLEIEGQKADKLAKKQGTGAAGSGAGAGAGTVTDPAQAPLPDAAQADQVAGWLIGGAIAILAVLAVYLVWRAYVNRQRATAYKAEAASA